MRILTISSSAARAKRFGEPRQNGKGKGVVGEQDKLEVKVHPNDVATQTLGIGQRSIGTMTAPEAHNSTHTDGPVHRYEELIRKFLRQLPYSRDDVAKVLSSVVRRMSSKSLQTHTPDNGDNGRGVASPSMVSKHNDFSQHLLLDGKEDEDSFVTDADPLIQQWCVCELVKALPSMCFGEILSGLYDIYIMCVACLQVH